MGPVIVIVSYLSRFLSPAEPVLERVMFLERLKGLLDCVQSYCTGLDHFLSLMLKPGGLAGGD